MNRRLGSRLSVLSPFSSASGGGGGGTRARGSGRPSIPRCGGTCARCSGRPPVSFSSSSSTISTSSGPQYSRAQSLSSLSAFSTVVFAPASSRKGTRWQLLLSLSLSDSSRSCCEEAGRHVVIRHNETTTGLNTLHTIDPGRWDLLQSKNWNLREHNLD